MTRPIVVAFVVLVLSAAGLAATATTNAAQPDLRATLATALRAEGIEQRRTAALVVDLRSDTVVFDERSTLPLRPASAEKLAVSLAALRLLGPAYRFSTEVVGTGRLDGRTWRGDLALVGHGDPSLALADMTDLARQVRAWGIRRVAGRVLGDERHFDSRRDAPGWKPGFAGIESRPLSALSVDETESRGLNGSAAAAAAALTAALERGGVTVGGAPRAGRPRGDTFPLALDLSEPLAEIVRHMNRESDNYYAELLLKELGARIAGRGTTRAGARVVGEALGEAGVPLAGVRIADGSGLSLDDRLTPRALVAMLRAGAADPSIRDAFLTSLAVAGVSGTLEDRMRRRPTRGQVIAKTGTTSAASALAGFVRRRYAFAIVQNGSPIPYWAARLAQDRFVTALARAQ